MFVIKKYFSLFTPTLITCLAVGSAPSRAMENLTEECWAKKGDIILLAGTSSSGKTTTTQQLKINCPNFEINGRDEIMSQVPQYGGYNPKESS